MDLFNGYKVGLSIFLSAFFLSIFWHGGQNQWQFLINFVPVKTN